MSTLDRRAFGALLLGAALWATAAAPAAAQSRTVAYVGQALSTTAAYLFDWQSATRATVVAGGGRTGGNVIRTGAQRIVTLDAPFSTETFGDDIDPCIGEQPLQRRDTLQLAVSTTSGTDSRGNSTVIELGTLTTLTGCNAGRVEPFGTLADPGYATRHLALTLRPPVTDLLPGVALAGPSEAVRDSPFIAADVLSFQAGGLGIFATSGNVVSAAFDANQWLLLGLPFGQRGYTRLYVDRRTGAEVWLDADWSAGQPTAVASTLMVKPVAGASLGTVRQASRMWQSGLATSSTQAFLIHLYQTGSGERVSRDLVAGTETRTPITWAFNSANIVQTRTIGSGTGVRTWTPLLNSGGRATFVMESERRFLADGSEVSFIAPRVNVYTDTGAATPPLPVRR